MKFPSLKTETIKQNQWIALIALLLIYKIYFVYFFYILPIGFNVPILQKLSLDSFMFSEIFQHDSFVLAACSYFYFIAPVVLLSAFLWFFSKTTAWQSIEPDFLKPTKYFILFIVLFTTWFFAFSEYNYYYDKPYYFDRFLIIAIAFSLFFYSWLMPLFIGLIVLWLSQFNFAIGPIGLTDKKIIYDILTLFLSYLFVKTVFKIKIQTLWLVVFSLIGSNYFIPAIYKMVIGPNWYTWVIENEMWVHLRAAFCSNWLVYLSNNQKDSLILWLTNGSFLIGFFTLLVEFLPVFILWKRSFTILLLILLCVFHFVVFILSGVFFWKWILFNLALIVILLVYKNAFNQIFTKPNLVASILIITFSNYLFNPVKLAWWDTALFEMMNYEVTDEKGNTFTLAGNQMRPYDQMGYQKLNYLIPDSVDFVDQDLKNYNDFKTLKILKIEDVKSWIHQNKSIVYNKQKALKFDEFISVYFYNYNKHVDKNDIYIPKFATLDHGWRNRSPKNKFLGDRRVKSFKVKLSQFYHTPEKSVLIDEKYIYEQKF